VKATLSLLIALAAGTAFGQYPYAYPPAYGYMNRNEALRQQAFENHLRWQAEQRRQWDFWFGTDPLDHGKKAAELRLLRQQERALRLDNDRRESAFENPFRVNNPFRQ